MNTLVVANEARSARSRSEPGLSDSKKHEDILLRRFRPDDDDEQQMRDLVYDNAFLGKPFDPICTCKKWFCDVVLTPYIEYQPENVQVAIHQPSGRLVGYLTGSTGGQQFETRQHAWIRKKVISLGASFTMPWTFFDFTSRSFATHVIFKGESERPNHPQSGVHWHYQVHKDFRGRDIGSKLLQRFTIDAIGAGFELIWAEVMAYPEKPRAYFENRGWSIYDAKPTGIFGDKVDFSVEVLCITKPLLSVAEIARTV
jgi:GNAT superfamily N-acetyltransferase